MIAPAKNLAAALLVAAIIALSVAPFLKQNVIIEQARTPEATVSKKAPLAPALAGRGSN